MRLLLSGTRTTRSLGDAPSSRVSVWNLHRQLSVRQKLTINATRKRLSQSEGSAAVLYCADNGR